MELNRDKYTQDEICDRLQVGKHKLQRVITQFKEVGTVPEPIAMGRQWKISNAIQDFIDIRTIQDARLSATSLVKETPIKFKKFLK